MAIGKTIAIRAIVPKVEPYKRWRGKRDSNPQSGFWRPLVYQLTDSPKGNPTPLTF